jgi:hypothetical protein
VAESAAFEAACTSIEQSGALDRLAARGTIRLALKQAGLEPRTVTPAQLRVVIEKVLPGELGSRGIAAPAELCARVAKSLESVDAGARGDTPETIFARLGGS